MSQQQARIRGGVNYRAGDGMPLPVPDGPASVEIADDSVTLAWLEGKDAGSAAITRDEFDRFVREGKIELEHAHA